MRRLRGEVGHRTLEIFSNKADGDRRYREIAEYFLAEVLAARNYVIGNTSLDEHWKTPPNQLNGTLAWTNAECCAAYNLMKLHRHVFSWTADARWMDAYERALFNCRLGTQNAQGLKQYFFPLAAGYWRAYSSPEESFWCCTGTGIENHAKYGDSIYFRGVEGGPLADSLTHLLSRHIRKIEVEDDQVVLVIAV